MNSTAAPPPPADLRRGCRGTYALCQAALSKPSMFSLIDYLVGTGEQHRRDGKTQSLFGLNVALLLFRLVTGPL